MNNEPYVKEIDLVELFFKILIRWRFVIGLAVLCALILGGGKAAAGFAQLNDADYMAEQTEKVEKEQREYDALKGLYETQLSNINQEIDVQNQYLSKSLYMSIDPYNEYQEVLSYYVSTDYKILPGMDYQNLNSMTSILLAYSQAADSDSVYERVASQLAEPVDAGFLQELVSINRDNGNGMLTIIVVGADEHIPSLLIREIQKNIEDSREKVRKTIGEHEITEVTHSTYYGVDTALIDKVQKYNETSSRLQDAAVKRRNELKALVAPTGSVPSRGSVVKNAIKYAVLGGVLGVFFACSWICMLFIMGDRIPNERDLKRLYGIPVLGRYHQAKKNGIDRRIELMEGIDASCCNENTAYAIAAANIANAAESGKSTMLVGSMAEEQLKDVYKSLLKSGDLSEEKFVLGGDMLSNPEVIRKLKETDAVVIAENLNTSKGTSFAKAVDMLKRQDKKILGIVEIS